LKQITGFEEEQTVKVVENGEGGPKRAWNPATRRGWTVTVKAAARRQRREVNSSGWERRRGEKLSRRMDVRKEQRSSAGPTSRPEKRKRSSRASERP
jgi:hypothetical protein